jgi:NAD(P)-dependent dehydrogenase (short-subunit alcohol dehydrogenase family)
VAGAVAALDLFDLSGRVCIVTGASSGLGDRFARVLHGAGAHVVACARRIKKLENLASECVGLNPLTILKCDVTSDEDRKRLVQETMKKFGRIDLLVNNAGVSGDDGLPATKVSPDTFLYTMDVNVNAVFFLTQEVRRVTRLPLRVHGCVELCVFASQTNKQPNEWDILGGQHHA